MTSINQNPMTPSNPANAAVGINRHPRSIFANPAKDRARPPSP